jgi:hypothetical protein
MKCFTLDASKESIKDYIDVSALDTAHLFNNPKKVKTAAFNTTIPELNWDPVVQAVVQRSEPDIFLYMCVDIVPGNSLSSVITEDCILLAYDVNKFQTMPEDRSMPLLTSGKIVYRLCFNKQTAIKSNKSGKIYYNNNGELTEDDAYKPTSEEPSLGKYGIELSF